MTHHIQYYKRELEVILIEATTCKSFMSDREKTLVAKYTKYKDNMTYDKPVKIKVDTWEEFKWLFHIISFKNSKKCFLRNIDCEYTIENRKFHPSTGLKEPIGCYQCIGLLGYSGDYGCHTLILQYLYQKFKKLNSRWNNNF